MSGCVNLKLRNENVNGEEKLKANYETGTDLDWYRGELKQVFSILATMLVAFKTTNQQQQKTPPPRTPQETLTFH